MGGEAVQVGDANLELRDLAVEVPCGKALPQQLDAGHLGLCTASAVIRDSLLARVQSTEIDRIIFYLQYLEVSATAMKGMSEQEQSAQSALSRRVIQKARRTARRTADHAGEFETLLMMAVARDQVDLSRLSKAADTVDRHDPENPIWGVIGADPRAADVADAQPLFNRMVRWLVGAIDRG